LQITKREIGPVETELTVEIPAEDIAARVAQEMRRFASKAMVPGFRKGHVPRNILRQRFGETITADAVDKSLQEYYRAALNEVGIEPVSPGSMEDVSYKDGEPLIFKVRIEKAPDFEIPDLSDITVELEQPQVSDEDVLEAVDALREQQAVLTPTDEPVSEDSVVMVDIQEVDQTGLPIVGRVSRDAEVDMRQNPFGKDFAQRIIGTKAGAHVRWTVNQRGNAQSEKSSVAFDIEVKSVHRKELPPFDDAFAASVNPNTPTADALKEDLRRSLAARAAAVARRKMQNHLIDALLHKVDFPVPPRMLDDYLNRLTQEAVGDETKDPSEVERRKEEYRTVGIRNIRWYMLRRKLATSQNLKATEEDIEREFEIYAKLSGKSRREVENLYAAKDKRSDLEESVTDRKIFAFLERQANILPVPVDLATFEGRGPGRIVAP